MVRRDLDGTSNTPEAMMMPEPKSSLPLADYKALRDSLRQKRELLPPAALAEALKQYIDHAKLETDGSDGTSVRQRLAGH